METPIRRCARGRGTSQRSQARGSLASDRIRGGLRLPEPMLLRSGRLPTTGDYAFEPKWDGFRALVAHNGRLRVISRRGWDMTSLLPELQGPPDGVAVDGELVALGDDGLPSFPGLCDRMLHGKRRIDVIL